MTEEELKELELKYLGNINLDLEHYRNLFAKGLELIKSEPQPKKLLLDILDEYLIHLQEIPAVDLSITKLDQLDKETKEKVKSLILFGTQAALIKDNADVQSNLRQVNSNYRDLLSVITHEFKNSLTSIYGYNRIIKKKLLDGNYQSLAEISNNIDRLTRNLFGTVETLFSMSLIEQGILDVDRKIFDLVEDALNPVISELEIRLQKKSMRVNIVSDEKKNLYFGDAHFFQLVFRNLIQNAIQYGSKNSQIKIEFSKSDNYLNIVVFNEGSGLDQDKLEKIFDKFSRFHNQSDKANVGIGLYAVKNIIELHKGSITAESESDKWMRFIIRLPIEV